MLATARELLYQREGRKGGGGGGGGNGGNGGTGGNGWNGGRAGAWNIHAYILAFMHMC